MPAVRAAAIRAPLGASLRSVSTRQPGSWGSSRPAGPSRLPPSPAAVPRASPLPSSSRASLPVPSACSDSGSSQFSHIRGRKHPFALYCCRLGPLAPGKPVCEVAASVWLSSARDHCCLRAERARSVSVLSESLQPVLNFTRAQPMRDSLQRRKKKKV